MKLIIEDDSGKKQTLILEDLLREQRELIIGRQEGAAIRLPERNVSRKHAKLVRSNGSLVVEDLGSFNGTKVNGERINGKAKLKDGDRLEIADYYLDFQGALEDVDGEAAPAPAAPEPKRESAPAAPAKPRPQPAPQPQRPVSSQSSQATAMINLKDLQGALGASRVEALPAKERPRLYILTGEEAGREMRVEKTEVKIGRDEDNDIVISHRSLSRSHAKLFRDDEGHWKIQDLGSANGTRVNGEAYAVAPVESGDTIELGHLKIKFAAPGDTFDIQAAIREAKGGAAAAAHDEHAAPVVVQKNNTPLIIGVSVASALIVALVVVLALRGGGGKSEEAGGEGAKLLKAAMDASKGEQFELCVSLVDQAGAKGADPVEAAKLKTICQTGAKDLLTLEKAVAARDAQDWDKAKTLLESIRSSSPVISRKEQIWETVKGPYVQKRLEKARALITGQTCKKEDALGQVALAKAADPSSADVAALEAEINAKVCAVAPPPPPKQEKIDCRAVLQDANKLVIGGEYEAAVKALSKVAVPSCPTEARGQAFRSLGIAYVKLSQMDKTITCWNNYISLIPDAPDAAKIRKMIGDYEAQHGKSKAACP